MDKKIIFNRMKHNPFFIIGVLVIIFLILVCFLSPLYIQFDPVKSNVTNKFQAPDFSQGLAGHLFSPTTWDEMCLPGLSAAEFL
mgnify:CR=1 FL=1